MKVEPSLSWWQTGIIYEIYIRSFQDTNGDGIGDLDGIRKRLDYLHWLGVQILWITPIYKSPQCDFGYDVADYEAIDSVYGTMEDFDRLLDEAHRKDIRIILDFVPNHTSDQHSWFRESRSSRDNEKGDWYIWRDPAPDGGPPNNWISAFDGAGAWEFNEARGQYYFHSFLKEQPDLNLRNPVVEEAIFNSMRFWLRRGVDGFRIDAMQHLIKDDRFRDDIPNSNYDPSMPSNDALRHLYSANRPECIDLLARMRNVLGEFDGDRVLVGESYLTGEALVNYYGPNGSGPQIPLNQHLIFTRWNAKDLRDSIEFYMAILPRYAWPNWVLGNHDKSRLATRLGGQEQARVATVLLLCLRGTPVMYYGNEIGLEDVYVSPREAKDPFSKLDPGKRQGRDPQRSPMPWDGSEYCAGFTTGSAWLPLTEDSKNISVETQKNDPDSMLNFVREIIQLRCREPALAIGLYRLILTDVNGPMVVFCREHENNRLLIALNLTADPTAFLLPHGYENVEVVISTIPGAGSGNFQGQVDLRGNEALILRCKS